MSKILIIKGADFSAVSIGQVPLDKVHISASASPSEGGVVSGAGYYDMDDVVTLVATANEGFDFDRWSDGVTNNTREIVVGEQDVNLTALFQPMDISEYVTESTESNNEFSRVLVDQNNLLIYGERLDGTIVDNSELIGNETFGDGTKVITVVNVYKNYEQD